CSYIWYWKHNVAHHTYTNINGADDDIEPGPMLRFTPHQPRYWMHRFQVLYVWALYGLMPIKWQFFDDFRDLVKGKIASNEFPRPRAWQWATIILGKSLFFSWSVFIPLLFHSFWVVLPYYFLAICTLGITLSVVFQLAHCVEDADFTAPDPEQEHTEHDWAVHQVRTTIDFAPHNRLLNWYVGGLNFQIEHHLFPHISHV